MAGAPEQADLLPIAARRLHDLAGLPIPAAAGGDEAAQRDLADTLSRLAAVYPDPRMTLGFLHASALLARMAAWHGSAESALGLAFTLARLSIVSSEEDVRKANLAESLAWLNRAADLGNARAADLLEVTHNSEDVTPEILTLAAQMGKRL